MTIILILLIAIAAACLTICSILDAVRIMRYNELKAKRSQMSLSELREDLNRQYYSQNMRETYERTEL